MKDVKQSSNRACRVHGNGISMLASVHCLSSDHIQYLLRTQHIWLFPGFGRKELLQSFTQNPDQSSVFEHGHLAHKVILQ